MSLFYGYHDGDENNNNNNNKDSLTKKGGEITGELILNKAIIKNNPINKYDIINVKYINSLFLETIILNELKESTGFYKIDRANNNKLSFNRTTRKISNLYDQSLSQNDATQSNNNIKPKLCKKKNRVNNRYFVEFNGRVFISDIDLSPSSGTPNITNFFVVYRLRGYDASINWLRNCFFVQNDRFVGFSTIGDLVISNSTNTFMRIGAANDAVAPFKNKANAGLLNKWYSLSVHWYDDGSSRTNKSSVYCNGVKLTNFTSTGLQLNKKNGNWSFEL